MEKQNLFQKKYDALELFYGWIDQGSDYNVAVEQSIYYNKQLDELDEIILIITIATRFARCGKEITVKFKEKLNDVILKYKELDLDKYNLSEEEINILNEDIEEVEDLTM